MIIRFPTERTKRFQEAEIERIEAMVQKFIEGMTGDVTQDGCTVTEEDNFDSRR